MNKRSIIEEYIDDLSKDQLVTLWNDYCVERGDIDNYIERMGSLNESMYGMSPTEILESVQRDFNTCHNYFICGCYGWESFDDPEEHIYKSDIINYMIDCNEYFGLDDLEREIDDREARIEEITDITATYAAEKAERQKETDALPIFWAFTDMQFEEEMTKRGLTVKDTDQLYKIGNGGFYLKKDADIIHKYFENDTMSEFLEDPDNRLSAFLYEMNNHEYSINLQADYDVCGCFVRCNYGSEKSYIEYFQEADHPEYIPQYKEARALHFELIDLEEWF